MALATWQATVQSDTSGAVIVSPVVTVRENGPSGNLADIYDLSGSPVSNPITGTSDGFVQFKAEQGYYWIEAVSGGLSTNQWYWDAVPFDALVEGDVQSGVADATVGKLLTNGAHGLGGRIIEFSGSIDDAAVMPTGFYRVTGAATGTKPSGLGSFNLVQLRRGAGSPFGNTSQIVISEGGIYTRAITTGGEWTSWVRSYDWSNILGTVSQSGGVPTGALFEPGSNANGNYVRLPDGTQICTALITGSGTSGVTWVYPAAFANSRADSVHGTKIGPAGYVHLSGVGNSTDINVNVRNSSDALVADQAFVTAVGRWF